MTRPVVPMLCFAVVLSAAPAAVGQPPDPRLAKVFADWDARRAGVAGVRYVLDGERVYFKRRTRDPMPPSPEKMWLPATDVTVKKKRTLVFDFPRERFRMEVDDEEYYFPAGPVSRMSEVHTFDGTTRKLWNRRAAEDRAAAEPSADPEPDIWVVKGGQSSFSGFDMLVYPLFFAHGNIEVGDAAVIPGRLKVRPDPELFILHGEARHDGRPVLVLRTRPERGVGVAYDEYWVDPGRESVIVRNFRYRDDEPVSDLTIRYQTTAAGWLPEGWAESRYEEKRLTDTTRVRVTALALDPSPAAETFDIPSRPGMLVFETTNRDHGLRVDPMGESGPVERYRADPTGRLRPVEVREGEVVEKSPFWWWVVLAVGGVLVVGLAWRVARRSRPGQGRVTNPEVER